MWVVKLGGSLAGGRWLRYWLDAIGAHGRGKVVVVPGGGVFADAVRNAQHCWRFSELAAHRMALRAMEQYGLMLCDCRPAFIPCAGEDGLRHALATGRVPVWLPGAMADEADDIQTGWAMTADSLAAWLCHRLGAGPLLLVKSCVATSDRVESLQAQGLLDGAFADFHRRLDCAAYVCGADAVAAFTAALTDSSPPGTRLAAASPRATTPPSAQAGAP